jgi:signal transduction histidine kinase
VSATTVTKTKTTPDAPTPERELVLPIPGPLAEERTRLAYAIHDGLTQVVTASVLELEWLARRVTLEPASAAEALSVAAAHLREALEEIRGVLSGLQQESGTPDLRLDRLIRDLLARWQLPASWSVEGDLSEVPGDVLDAASAVIREGVANAAKHASAQAVGVRVRVSTSDLEICVEDDGAGFRPADATPVSGHLGLDMVRRRVAEVHGTLELTSDRGSGTRLMARLPLEAGGQR